MPTTNYVYCRCCGNQFTDDYEEDARYFVCCECDELRDDDDEGDDC